MKLLFIGSGAVTVAAFIFLPKVALAVAAISFCCRLVIVAHVVRQKRRYTLADARTIATASQPVAWRPFEPLVE